MTALVTTDAARRHLQLTETDMADPDIAANVADDAETATAIVLRHIKEEGTDWTDATVPFDVKAAILLTLGTIYRDRENGGLPDSASSLLETRRRPTVA
jgi:hypothetical protein